MHRSSLILPILVIALAGGFGLMAQPPVMAQDATPEAQQVGMGGLTFTLLGFVAELNLPSPAIVELARAEFEPGAGFPFYPGEPTGALIIVETGTLTARVEDQAWSISRGGALQEMFASPEAGTDLADIEEEVAAGETATLQAGDIAYVPGGVTGDVRNDGPEPTMALLILIAPSAASSPAATPAP